MRKCVLRNEIARKVRLWCLIALINLMCSPIIYGQALREAQAALPDVYFDESMQKAKYDSFLQKSSLLPKYEFFKELFNKNKPQKMQLYTSPQIPKKIHQIWLGSPLPERYKEWQKTWLKYHPDWEYKLWTDKDVEPFNMKNKKYFDQAANYGEKSDIWRYEILERHGGLYVDLDCKCYQPFDILHHLYDFYAGLEPLALEALHVGNALIGARPHHPIINALVRDIPHQFMKHYQDTALKNTVMKTGPHFLTKTILENSDRSKSVLVFPSSYFFPLIESYDDKKKERPETFSIHYWSLSWVKK